MRWNGRGELECPLRGQSLESRLAAQRSVGRTKRCSESTERHLGVADHLGRHGQEGDCRKSGARCCHSRPSSSERAHRMGGRIPIRECVVLSSRETRHCAKQAPEPLSSTIRAFRQGSTVEWAYHLWPQPLPQGPPCGWSSSRGSCQGKRAPGVDRSPSTAATRRGLVMAGAPSNKGMNPTKEPPSIM
jgi:hypothetical protein